MPQPDVFRRLCFALDLDAAKALAIFERSDAKVSAEDVGAMLPTDEEVEPKGCSVEWLAIWLDNLIDERRGPRDPNAPARPSVELINNGVLKKIRIAMDYKEDTMLEVFKVGGKKLSSSELSALFRKPGNKHYRECDDLTLRIFLNGLTHKLRS